MADAWEPCRGILASRAVLAEELDEQISHCFGSRVTQRVKDATWAELLKIETEAKAEEA